MNHDPSTPDQDGRQLTYLSNTIPWFVRLMWVVFWIFAVAYAIAFFLPAIQKELVTPP